MPGRPPKPVKLLKMEGRSHRTKAELEAREKAEKQLLTGQKMKAWPEVRGNKLARLYFPDDLVSAQYAKEDDSTHEYEKLMKPSSYTGRVERRKGAITQPHRPVIK